MLHGGQRASPVVFDLRIQLQVDQVPCILLPVSDNLVEVTQDGYLLFETFLLLVVLDLGVGVTHDCDEQVQKDEGNDIGGHDEEDPDEEAAGLTTICLMVVLAKEHQILADECIDHLTLEVVAVQVLQTFV